MTTLSSIVEVLQSVARRNKLHGKIALGMLVILGLFEVGLLSVGSSAQGLQRLEVLVEGGLLITMILLPYTLIRNLQKQMKMVVALIDRTQEQTAMERLVGPIGARAAKTDTADGPLKDILVRAQRLDKRQRRSFIATTIGLLAVAGIAGVIVGPPSSYLKVINATIEGINTSVGAVLRGQQREQVVRDRERVGELTPQVAGETHPPKEEPESPGKERPQAVTETQKIKEVNRGEAKQGAPADPEQLAALRRQVDVLQQELSATRQKLQQERLKAAVLEEGTKAYGKGPGELQRRVEELERTSAEQDYRRLVNEALAYTYRNGPGDAERAESSFRDAIRIAQDKSIRDPVVYNAYAAFLQEQGKFREA
ncbi:MAG TPA: hypothetical protein VFM04_00865, partial [Candidatus Methylomirabilis sp.]|nr:hypothetical protein [Candidatus Methylomirabilis sp.]